jgi:predicted ATPase
MPKITAIELENFQSIGSKTIIPIRDLTLMFGPNGAGKSSIFDALDLLKIILSDDWGIECSKLIAHLNKWSRNNGTENASNSLGIGIQIYFDEFDASSISDEEKYRSLDKIFHFMLARGEDYAEDFSEKIYRFFIKFGKGEFSAWSIEEIDISSEGNQILHLIGNEPGKYPIAYLHKQEWINFYDVEKLLNSNDDISYSDNILSGKVRCEIGYDAFPTRWFGGLETRINYDLESAFVYLLKQIILFFKILISHELKHTSLVKASRTVPTLKESISIIPGEKDFGKKTSKKEYALEYSPLLNNLSPSININDDHWVKLCRAVADSFTSDNDEISTSWSDLSILGRINNLLREELFIENGYRLTGEVFLTLPINAAEDFSQQNSYFYPKLVRLYLIDNHQRKLEIEDVGSGIGYVLPVLSSIVQDEISMIQQPELHLHPKLQSMLGDAIVKAVENKKTFGALTIVETHSEHILLRIMRLLKNSENRKESSENLISYDRVCVLYFDPLPSGETKIRRLRLAPDGQLIDRWPGGFFNERFRDLFDE